MKTTTLRILLATSLSLAAFGASAKTDQAVGHPEDYKVFIDAPTGYAFVRTPSRWVFTRKIEGAAESSADKRVGSASLPR